VFGSRTTAAIEGMRTNFWLSLRVSAPRFWRNGQRTLVPRSSTPPHSPEVWELCEPRDRTSDTVRIYAAMAVEGFLDFCGVLRLGQDVFDDHFERLGLVQEVRALLLVCDQLDVSRQDPLVICLDKLAMSKNALVHPKTREVVGDPQTHQRSSIKVPEAARECVENMEAFFQHFLEAVPDAALHLDRK
jgi:hypothetical protein